VPVFYQKHFVNENGLLWVYDRYCQTFKELNPRVVCFETDLYAFRPKDRPVDLRVESDVLGPIDSMGCAAINLIRSTNQVDRPAISYFAGFQYTRLPSRARLVVELHERLASAVMRSMASSVERMQSIIDGCETKTGETIGVPAESMVEAVQSDQIGLTANKTVALKDMIKQAKMMGDFLESQSWEIIETTPDTGFIICDYPVVVVPPRGIDQVGFAVPGTVTYFPLMRRLCLRITQKGTQLNSRTVGRETARVVNRNIAAHSNRFIMSPLRPQLERVIEDSGTAVRNPKPRFTIETIETRAGGSLQLTTQPGRYFYLDDGRAP
jgi:hypothetical protein